MRKNRTKIALVILIALCVAVIGFLWSGFRLAVNKMHTGDTIAQIMTTLGNTSLGTDPLKMDVTTEAKKRFPMLPIRNGQIIDSWGNAIVLNSKETSEGWRVTITSLGCDGALGTKDDLVRDYVISDKLTNTQASTTSCYQDKDK